MNLFAEIIAIGSELLTPAFKDTNSLYLTQQLNAVGIPVVMKTIVGDDEHYLEEAIRAALARTPVVITIGGLGPTEDDVTRKVVGRVLQRQLVLNDDILAKLQARFKARGIEMPANNARQALVLTGCDILENRHGTAPGLWIAAEKTR
jgi:nicotinamide-nucleotide amidase